MRRGAFSWGTRLQRRLRQGFDPPQRLSFHRAAGRNLTRPNSRNCYLVAYGRNNRSLASPAFEQIRTAADQGIALRLTKSRLGRKKGESMFAKKFTLVAAIASLVAGTGTVRAEDNDALLNLLVKKHIITEKDASEVRSELEKTAAKETAASLASKLK